MKRLLPDSYRAYGLWMATTGRMRFLSVSVGNSAALSDRLYLTIPPSMFRTVIEGSKQSPVVRVSARVVVEKPFWTGFGLGANVEPDLRCLPTSRRSFASTTT